MNIHKKPMFARKTRPSTASAVRVRSSAPSTKPNKGILAAIMRKLPVTTTNNKQVFPQRHKKTMLLMLLLLLIIIIIIIAAGIWLLPLVTKKPDQTPAWQACLPQEKNGFAKLDEHMQPTLMAIPAGTYDLPSQTSRLFSFLNPYNIGTITIKNTIFMQEQKVSHALFGQYADFVENLPPGEEKDRRKNHIGLLWNKGETTQTSVQGISWDAATDFSNWLSQKTGCDYNIPSSEEWAAAIIHLYSTGEQVPKPGNNFSPTPMKSLLRGGREWTLSPCAMGYFLVGEDNWIAGPGSNQATCMPPLFSIAGFRVVLNPAKPKANTNLSSPPIEQEGDIVEPADQTRETNQ